MSVVDFPSLVTGATARSSLIFPRAATEPRAQVLRVISIPYGHVTSEYSVEMQETSNYGLISLAKKFKW